MQVLHTAQQRCKHSNLQSASQQYKRSIATCAVGTAIGREELCTLYFGSLDLCFSLALVLLVLCTGEHSVWKTFQDYHSEGECIWILHSIQVHCINLVTFTYLCFVLICIRYTCVYLCAYATAYATNQAWEKNNNMKVISRLATKTMADTVAKAKQCQ